MTHENYVRLNFNAYKFFVCLFVCFSGTETCFHRHILFTYCLHRFLAATAELSSCDRNPLVKTRLLCENGLYRLIPISLQCRLFYLHFVAIKTELYKWNLSSSSAQSVSLCHLIWFLQQPYDIPLLKGHTAHKTQMGRRARLSGKVCAQHVQGPGFNPWDRH